MGKRVAFLDCVGGVSGDMLLGATVDAGVRLEALSEVVAGLALGDVRLEAEKAVSKGISGTRVKVICSEQHAHRHLSDILGIINRARLPETVRNRATQAFHRLAQAEAKIHGCGVEDVHFHEVGAVDAIVDIVGVCAAFEILGVEEVYGSPLPAGEGFVKCAHGVIPIPAPATLEILRGWPFTSDRVPGETVTPTGATLLMTLAGEYRARPGIAVEQIGYGLGSKEWPDRPNAVRISVGVSGDGDSGEAAGVWDHGETVTVLETNIDNMNPEFFGRICPRLLAQGALDVFCTPIQMKKGRPGVLLSVLCRAEQVEAIAGTIFAETTTLGVRMRTERRICQDRRYIDVDVLGHPVRIKLANMPGSDAWPNLAPEFEDCQSVADQTGRTLKEIYSRAVAAAVAQLDGVQVGSNNYEE